MVCTLILCLRGSKWFPWLFMGFAPTLIHNFDHSGIFFGIFGGFLVLNIQKTLIFSNFDLNYLHDAWVNEVLFLLKCFRFVLKFSKHPCCKIPKFCPTVCQLWKGAKIARKAVETKVRGVLKTSGQV